MKKKAKKRQIINIRNEKGNISLYSTDTKQIIRWDFKQLYANKFDTSDKWTNSLKTIIFQNIQDPTSYWDTHV